MFPCSPALVYRYEGAEEIKRNVEKSKELKQLATLSEWCDEFLYSGCSVSFCAASELLFLNANELALEVEVGGALDLEVVENPSQAAVHAVLCLRARFHYRMQKLMK